jgi:hypothetical protein
VSRLWAALNLVGLLCGFFGALLLFFSLTLKSSNYRLVETSNHGVAVCLNNKLVATGFGGQMVVTEESCPKGIGPSIAPVIQAEKPAYVPCGLALIGVGFLLQLPSAWLPLFTK